MAVTLSDDEVSDHESGSDDKVSENEFGSNEDGNLITFIVTTVVDESVVVEENPFNGELFDCACKRLLISYARLLQRMQ